MSITDLKQVKVDQLKKKFLNMFNFQTLLAMKLIILLFFTVCLQVSAGGYDTPEKKPDIMIVGKVVDREGNPLPNVSVIVPGTTLGTTTNKEGRYIINAPESQNLVLEFSIIGFATQKVDVGNRTTINVVMEPENLGLEEVVVIGYGQEKEVNLSTAQSGISSDKFKQEPVMEVAQAINGRISGVSVQQTNGDPKGGFSIRVRGSNSINGNNSPLYVVDGLQLDQINEINPNDISSIQVLKDASATAIYGSRGANGVILISTKKGGEDDILIHFKGSVGLQSLLRKIDLLNGLEFAETVNAQRESVGLNPAFTEQDISRLNKDGGTDWQDLTFRNNSPVQQYYVSVGKKNSDGLSFFVSGKYLGNKTISRFQHFEQYSIRSNINYKASEKINLNLILFGNRSMTNGLSVDARVATRMDPTLPLIDENGNYTITSPFATHSPNPYLVATTGQLNNVSNQIGSIAKIDYKIADFLTFSVFGGLEHLNDNNNSYQSKIIDQLGKGNVASLYNLLIVT